jgi:hypothetical protein
MHLSACRHRYRRLSNSECYYVGWLSIRRNIDDQQYQSSCDIRPNVVTVQSIAVARDGASSTLTTASQGGQAVFTEFSV